MPFFKEDNVFLLVVNNTHADEGVTCNEMRDASRTGDRVIQE